MSTATNFCPAMKIINLLSQVQENCSSDEARLIDKVLEFLKREGLYSPQMKEIRTDDPIATDLIGALLTVRMILLPTITARSLIHFITLTGSKCIFIPTQFKRFDCSDYLQQSPIHDYAGENEGE